MKIGFGLYKGNIRLNNLADNWYFLVLHMYDQ